MDSSEMKKSSQSAEGDLRYKTNELTDLVESWVTTNIHILKKQHPKDFNLEQLETIIYTNVQKIIKWWVESQ